jgi:hypothetical protein
MAADAGGTRVAGLLRDSRRQRARVSATSGASLADNPSTAPALLPTANDLPEFGGGNRFVFQEHNVASFGR